MQPFRFDAFMKHRYTKFVPVFLVVFGLSMLVIIDTFVSLRGVQRRSNLASTGSSPEIAALPMAPRNDTVSESVEGIVSHTSLPSEVRGIYWTANTAGSSRAQDLLTYMLETGLNTVVIDLKLDNGALAFVPVDETLRAYVSPHPPIDDLDTLLSTLQDNAIYRIARIPVMRDGVFAQAHPEMAMKTRSGALWQDKIGSLWIDPAVDEVATYAITLAQEAYTRGFDEVQFDYVRFASDGSVNQIVYPTYDGIASKSDVLYRFFQRVGGTMKQEGIPVSFDVFGMTFWSFGDYNIGQRLVDVFPYTDWTSPMVYPSHYPSGFEGFANPAVHPYEIVKASLDEGTAHVLGTYAGTEAELRASFRPWLQDFDIGAMYTANMIEAQIQAARNAGASGWLLWNARNVYERAEYR